MYSVLLCACSINASADLPPLVQEASSRSSSMGAASPQHTQQAHAHDTQMHAHGNWETSSQASRRSSNWSRRSSGAASAPEYDQHGHWQQPHYRTSPHHTLHTQQPMHHAHRFSHSSAGGGGGRRSVADMLKEGAAARARSMRASYSGRPSNGTHGSVYSQQPGAGHAHAAQAAPGAARVPVRSAHAQLQHTQHASTYAHGTSATESIAIARAAAGGALAQALYMRQFAPQQAGGSQAQSIGALHPDASQIRAMAPQAPHRHLLSVPAPPPRGGPLPPPAPSALIGVPENAVLKRPDAASRSDSSDSTDSGDSSERAKALLPSGVGLDSPEAGPRPAPPAEQDDPWAALSAAVAAATSIGVGSSMDDSVWGQGPSLNIASLHSGSFTLGTADAGRGSLSSHSGGFMHLSPSHAPTEHERVASSTVASRVPSWLPAVLPAAQTPLSPSTLPLSSSMSARSSASHRPSGAYSEDSRSSSITAAGRGSGVSAPGLAMYPDASATWASQWPAPRSFTPPLESSSPTRASSTGAVDHSAEELDDFAPRSRPRASSHQPPHECAT